MFQSNNFIRRLEMAAGRTDGYGQMNMTPFHEARSCAELISHPTVIHDFLEYAKDTQYDPKHRKFAFAVLRNVFSFRREENTYDSDIIKVATTLVRDQDLAYDGLEFLGNTVPHIYGLTQSLISTGSVDMPQDVFKILMDPSFADFVRRLSAGGHKNASVPKRAQILHKYLQGLQPSAAPQLTPDGM